MNRFCVSFKRLKRREEVPADVALESVDVRHRQMVLQISLIAGFERTTSALELRFIDASFSEK